MRGTAPFGSLSVSSLRVACTAQLPIVSLQGSDHRSWLIAAALLLGLALDAFGGIGGQVAASALAWALLMFLVRRETAAWRVTLIAATAFACIAEVFFSLILGWYDYRFFNVPGFVPPGHVLLFMLGTSLARNVPDRLTNIIPPLAVAYAMFAVWSRWSSLDMLLLFLFLIAFYFGRARKTYAVMLILALALELLGTWLGSWRWQPEVMGLTTSNPPVLAGAAYVYFDAYVRTSARIIHRYMGYGRAHAKWDIGGRATVTS